MMAKAAKKNDDGHAPENWPASRVELWSLAKIVPYEKNPRNHTEEQITLIASSMLSDGVTAPILVDEDGVIIYGHGRRLAAIKNGFEQYPVVVARGWSEEKKRAVRIKDNSYALLASWDVPLLMEEIGLLKAEGFDLPLLGFPEHALIGWGIATGNESQADPDAAPEPPNKPVSRKGDIWILGGHRLLCGDATSESDVAVCLAGAKPHLLVSDAPYGVEYDANWRNERDRANGKSYGARAIGKVNNDHEADWRKAWELFDGDVIYAWSADLRSRQVVESLESCGFVMRAQIIWVKDRLIISRGDYHFMHEPCWYAVRKGRTGHWSGDRKQTTVWNIAHLKSETGHSTQKPIECMKRPIENNSRAGDFIYEPFSGSGTTIIAAEMTARKCLAIEIDPAYIDVAVLRWQTFTGKEAILEATGRTFEETRKERARKAAPPRTAAQKRRAALKTAPKQPAPPAS